MSYVYIHPFHNAFAKLFLVDFAGKYKKWPSTTLTAYGKYGRMSISRRNNDLALCITGRTSARCRETLCNSFNHLLTNIYTPPGTRITLEPPKTKAGRPLIKDTSAFIMHVGGSANGKKVYSSAENADKIFTKGYKLSTTKKSMTELYALMDVIMGTAALLMAGPTAYVRTLTSRNAVTVSKPELVAYYDRRNGEPKRTKTAKARLKYTGLSNFWVRHPANLSILSGLSRMCLELCIDGKYTEIDDEVDVAGVRYWLAELAKKSKFTKTDRKELIEVLGWLKPYFESDKVLANLGSYPINKLTYDMFLQFCESGTGGGSLSSQWRAENGPYGLANYGFVVWCRRQRGSAAWEHKSNPKSWSGLSGKRLGFSGH